LYNSGIQDDLQNKNNSINFVPILPLIVFDPNNRFKQNQRGKCFYSLLNIGNVFIADKIQLSLILHKALVKSTAEFKIIVKNASYPWNKCT